MNRTHTILAVTVASAVLVGWQVLDRNGPRPGEPPRAAALQPAGQAPDGLAGQPDRPSPDGRSVDPAAPGEAAPPTIARTCDPHTTFIPDARTGEVLEAIDCESRSDPDPYEDWDDDALAELAYADGHAAEVLGLRLILSENPLREAAGLGLLYRAVALSGDAGTFRKAIGFRYAYVSEDGEPQIENLKQMLVFNVIGEALGDPGFHAARLERALRRADVAEQEIAEIRSGAHSVLVRMAALQTEVTGDTSIREALENA